MQLRAKRIVLYTCTLGDSKHQNCPCMFGRPLSHDSGLLNTQDTSRSEALLKDLLLSGFVEGKAVPAASGLLVGAKVMHTWARHWSQHVHYVTWGFASPTPSRRCSQPVNVELCAVLAVSQQHSQIWPPAVLLNAGGGLATNAVSLPTLLPSLFPCSSMSLPHL